MLLLITLPAHAAGDFGFFDSDMGEIWYATGRVDMDIFYHDGRDEMIEYHYVKLSKEAYDFVYWLAEGIEAPPGEDDEACEVMIYTLDENFNLDDYIGDDITFTGEVFEWMTIYHRRHIVVEITSVLYATAAGDGNVTGAALANGFPHPEHSQAMERVLELARARGVMIASNEYEVRDFMSDESDKLRTIVNYEPSPGILLHFGYDGEDFMGLFLHVETEDEEAMLLAPIFYTAAVEVLEAITAQEAEELVQRVTAIGAAQGQEYRYTYSENEGWLRFFVWAPGY